MMEITEVHMEKQKHSKKWLLTITLEVGSIAEITEINEALNFKRRGKDAPHPPCFSPLT